MGDPSIDIAENVSSGDGFSEEEIQRILWNDSDNPWKKEAVETQQEKDQLEGEVLRLQNKIMFLNGELNKLKSPPMIVGTIIDHFKDDMMIISTSGGPSFVVRFSSALDRDDLQVGTQVSLNKDSMSIIGTLPSSRDPLVGASEILERPDVSFKDVGGLQKQINELKEVVELPLLRPDLFKGVGIEPPKGVLLIGPPGCGKTLLAKAVANSTEATFLRMVGSELVQKYIGEGSRMVRELFQLAKDRSPSILFLDELDSVAGRRTESTTSADREVHRTLIQLLSELDGFDPLSNVSIIAATNRPDILDPAILRPGRIDRVIDIPLPDQGSRMEIFRVHTMYMNIDTDVDLEEISRGIDGFNGSQIKAVCTEAGMFAIRDERKKVTTSDMKAAVRKIRDSGAEGGLIRLNGSSTGKSKHPMFV
ncbi:MAG: proteasome-activating nucleotidase [Thermoplasmata archaeon]|nr:proteasome-activating nucleotidase [Thermoplasmata archaeon]